MKKVFFNWFQEDIRQKAKYRRQLYLTLIGDNDIDLDEAKQNEYELFHSKTKE